MSERTDNDDGANETDGEGEQGYESTGAAETGPETETDAGTGAETNAGITEGNETARSGGDEHEGTAETVSLTTAHQGAEVIDADGETVGLITEIEDDRIHVDPDPGITDRIKAELGWGSADEGDTTIRRNQIEETGRNEVRLSRSGQDELE